MKNDTVIEIKPSMKALSDRLWEKLQESVSAEKRKQEMRKKIDALKVKIRKEKQLEMNMQLKITERIEAIK